MEKGTLEISKTINVAVPDEKLIEILEKIAKSLESIDKTLIYIQERM